MFKCFLVYIYPKICCHLFLFGKSSIAIPLIVVRVELCLARSCQLRQDERKVAKKVNLEFEVEDCNIWNCVACFILL